MMNAPPQEQIGSENALGQMPQEPGMTDGSTGTELGSAGEI